MLDIQQIEAYNYEAYKPMLTPDAREIFEAQYITEELPIDCFGFGIVEDDYAVGAILLEPDGEGEMTITSLFVRQACRRKGYGTELVLIAADFLLLQEEISSIGAHITEFVGEENPLFPFFEYLEFQKTEETEVGAFYCMVEDLDKVPRMKNVDTASVMYGNQLNLYQWGTLDSQAHVFLDEMALANDIEKDISTFLLVGDEVSDCMIFTGDADQLVLEWTSTDSAHPLAFVQLLYASIDAIMAKYGSDTKIIVPFISDNTEKLICKFLGDMARPLERNFHFSYNIETEDAFGEEITDEMLDADPTLGAL